MASLSSAVKNTAVIECIGDGSVHVVLAYSLEQFSRSWVDTPTNWPEPVVWFNDSQDIDCRILKIDTKEECDNYAEWYNESKKTDEVESVSLPEQIHELENEIRELKSLVLVQQKELVALRRGNASKLKMYSVGAHGMLVNLQGVLESMVQGFDGTGFMNLAERQFGKNFFLGKSWKSLDSMMQQQLTDLIIFFVTIGLTRELQTQPKPSESNNKYKAVYYSFTTMLNNRKYAGKMEKKLATQNANSSGLNRSIKTENQQEDSE